MNSTALFETRKDTAAKRKSSLTKVIKKNWPENADGYFEGASVETLRLLANLSAYYPWSEASPALNQAKEQEKEKPKGARGYTKGGWTPTIVKQAHWDLKSQTAKQEDPNGGGIHQGDSDLERSTLPPTTFRTEAQSNTKEERQGQRRQTQPPDEDFTAEVLRSLQELFDQKLVRFFRSSDDTRTLQMSDSGVILGSVRIGERHRVAVRFRHSATCVDIYDSLHPKSDRDSVQTEVVRFYMEAFNAEIKPHVTYSAPVIRDENHSEVVVLIVLVCLALDTSIDPAMDAECCRQMLTHLCPSHAASQDAVSEDEPRKLPIPESFRVLSSKEEIPLHSCGLMLDELVPFAQTLASFLEDQQTESMMRKPTLCVSFCSSLVRKMRDAARSSNKLSPYIAGCLGQAETSLWREIVVRENIRKARALGGMVSEA